MSGLSICAKADIEEHKDGTSSIIVTELPYQVNKKMLVESIANLVKEKKIEGLSDIDDHSSDRVGIRLEIFLKRDANPAVVLNQLYKYTRLQDSFSVNMLAISDGRPKTLNLKEVLSSFITFQEEIVTRRIKFDLEKAKARMHILEGLKIALDNIDEIIDVIRNSYDNAKERLMERFGFSEIQAQSVLDMRLAQLQKLNGEKIDEEYDELCKRAEEYNRLLSDKSALMEQIKDELLEIKDKYGDERSTQIENNYDEIDDEDLIEEEENVVTLTHFGYVKRLPSDTYKAQKRGGKGIIGLQTREEDFVEKILTCSTHDFMLFFTDKGRMYKLKTYQIPEAGRTAKGTAIVNLLQLESDEKVTATIPIKSFDDGKYLMMMTRNGTIKKTPLNEYNTARKGGIRAIELEEDNELINVILTDGSQSVVIGTHNGNAIRFDEADVRSMGRVARGVRGVRLADDDYVVGIGVCREGADVLVVSENGFGKRTSADEYKIQTRGGKGVTTYKISEKTGKVAGIHVVDDSNDIMLITSEGTIIRMAAADINTLGRATKGVTMMRMDDGVKIVGVALTEHEEPVDEEEEKPTETEVTAEETAETNEE